MEKTLWQAWKRTVHFMVSPWDDETEEGIESQEELDAREGRLSPSCEQDSSADATLEEDHSLCTNISQQPEKTLSVSTDRECALSHGPLRMVTVNDGAENFMALVLSEDLIAELNGVLRGLNRVDRLQDKSDSRELRHNVTDTVIRRSQEQISELETALAMPETLSGSIGEGALHELDELKHSLSQLETTQGHNANKKEEAEQNLHLERVFQRSRLETFLGMLKSVIPSHHLTDDEASTVDDDDDAAEDDICTTNETSHRENEAESSVLDLEELNLESTKEEYRSKRDTLRWLQGEFEGRRDKYYEQLAEFGEAKENGECSSMSMSDFDRGFLLRSQQLTQALGQAEMDFAEVKAQVLALELDPAALAYMDSTMTIPETAYSVDGMDVMLEAEAIASVDRDFIEYWIQKTIDAGNLGPDEAEDEPDDRSADDWDAESLCPGDSISQVAEGYYREEIDRWRCRCDELRCRSPTLSDA
ncbi:MAG: hypothetical protein M1812_007698 [Candelaria pacifica]|nr:MAG: hypothetical protein M1812_007698 [Candelaria pacifica]